MKTQLISLNMGISVLIFFKKDKSIFEVTTPTSRIMYIMLHFLQATIMEPRLEIMATGDHRKNEMSNYAHFQVAKDWLPFEFPPATNGSRTRENGGDISRQITVPDPKRIKIE